MSLHCRVGVRLVHLLLSRTCCSVQYTLSCRQIGSCAGVRCIGRGVQCTELEDESSVLASSSPYIFGVLLCACRTCSKARCASSCTRTRSTSGTPRQPPSSSSAPSTLPTRSRSRCVTCGTVQLSTPHFVFAKYPSVIVYYITRILNSYRTHTYAVLYCTILYCYCTLYIIYIILILVHCTQDYVQYCQLELSASRDMPQCN